MDRGDCISCVIVIESSSEMILAHSKNLCLISLVQLLIYWLFFNQRWLDLDKLTYAVGRLSLEYYFMFILILGVDHRLCTVFTSNWVCNTLDVCIFYKNLILTAHYIVSDYTLLRFLQDGDLPILIIVGFLRQEGSTLLITLASFLTSMGDTDLF